MDNNVFVTWEFVDLVSNLRLSQFTLIQQVDRMRYSCVTERSQAVPSSSVENKPVFIRLTVGSSAKVQTLTSDFDIWQNQHVPVGRIHQWCEFLSTLCSRFQDNYFCLHYSIVFKHFQLNYNSLIPIYKANLWKHNDSPSANWSKNDLS